LVFIFPVFFVLLIIKITGRGRTATERNQILQFHIIEGKLTSIINIS